MKYIRLATFALLLVTWVFAKPQTQNPYSVWCDFHNAYFNKSGTTYPNGVCYDVYKHTYYSNGNTYVHTMTMKCR